jgi:outer membrane protein assembly factor BamB
LLAHVSGRPAAAAERTSLITLRKPMKATLIHGCTAVLFLATLIPDAAVGDWPMHRGNLQRTGNVDGKPGPTKPQILWVHHAQTQLVASPALSDTALYLSGLDAFNSGSFLAFSTAPKAARRELWVKKPPFLKMPAVSSPVLTGDLLLFGDGMHQTSGATLYCLKAETGFPLWQYPVPGELVHMEGGPAVAQGKIYIGGGSAGVLCVDMNQLTLDGKSYDLKSAEALLRKLWQELEKKYEADKKANPATARAPDEALLPQPRPKLVWQQGKEKWHVDSAVAVTDGKVLAASAFLDQEQLGERVLYCLKEADGSTLWKVALKHNPWAGPTVADGLVLVGCSSTRLDPNELALAKGEVVAADLAKGTVKWRKPIPGGVVSPVAVHEQTAIFTATDGKVRAWDLKTGRTRWTYDAHAPLFAGPAIAGKTVYVADLKGKVHAVSLLSGTKQWVLDVAADPAVKSPGMFYSSPVVHGGRLYVATCNLAGENTFRPTVVVCIGEK